MKSGRSVGRRSLQDEEWIVNEEQFLEVLYAWKVGNLNGF